MWTSHATEGNANDMQTPYCEIDRTRVSRMRCKMTLVPVADEGRYLLRLGDGQEWEMVAAEGVGRWLGKLASIMKLESCRPAGRPQMIFAWQEESERWRPDIKSIRESLESLPHEQWNVRQHRDIHFWMHKEVPDVICILGENGDPAREISVMELSLLPVYIRVLESGGLPFHCALLEGKGRGVLLPARGGTGKSTCCLRVPPPWKGVSDDLSLIVRSGDTYRAHPFPTWSDHVWQRAETKWETCCHYPLSAILFLEQGSEDRILPIGRGEAAARIAESAEQILHHYIHDLEGEERKKLKERIFENACEISRKVTSFRLSATLNGRFWEKMVELLGEYTGG